jgi:hypothetical protein
MLRIGVKYCGGCNPEIHRSKLVEQVARLLGKDCCLETGRSIERWELAIVVCGCGAACLDRPETRDFARNVVLVSGSMVDWHAVPLDRLATCVVERLQELICYGEGESS